VWEDDDVLDDYLLWCSAQVFDVYTYGHGEDIVLHIHVHFRIYLLPDIGNECIKASTHYIKYFNDQQD